jgi:tetratricopeptide (TPR) repeat protein
MKRHTEEALMASIELDPANPMHLYRIACHLYDNKEIFNYYSKACELIHKAQTLDPMNGEYHYKLAMMHLDNECWNQVYRHLKSCIELGYKTRSCQKLMKATKVKEEEATRKRNETCIALWESEPGKVEYLVQLGHHFNHKDKDKAYGYYKKALEIDPDEPEAHCGLGSLYGRDGNMEKAIEHLKKGYGPDKHNDHDDHYDEVARVYEDHGDWNSALEWRKKAVDAYPDEVDNLNSLAWVYAKLKREEEAAELYLKAIEKAPSEKNRGAYMVLPAYFYAKGEKQKAFEYIVEGINHHPNDYYFPFSLGRLHYLNKEYSKAEECFLTALSFKADDQYLLGALGTLYLCTEEMFDRNKGKKYFLKVLDINPDHLTAHDNLGKIFEEEGNTKKAEYHKKRQREINIKELFR